MHREPGKLDGKCRAERAWILKQKTLPHNVRSYISGVPQSGDGFIVTKSSNGTCEHSQSGYDYSFKYHTGEPVTPMDIHNKLTDKPRKPRKPFYSHQEWVKDGKPEDGEDNKVTYNSGIFFFNSKHNAYNFRYRTSSPKQVIDPIFSFKGNHKDINE